MGDPARQLRTDSVEPSERLHLWEEWNASHLIGVRASSVHDDLRLSSTQWLSDRLTVTDIAGTGHLVDHTDRGRRLEAPRSVFLGVMLSGTASFHGSNGLVSLHQGEGIAYRSDAPHIMAFDSGLRYAVIGVPLDLAVGEWGGHLPEAALPASATSMAGLVPLIERIGRGESLEAGALEDAVRAVLVPPEAGPTAVLARAVAVTRARLREPGFGPEQLATALGLSPRQVHRMLVASDTTPARLILGERLDAARRDVRGRPDLSLTDIAMRWGFASPSHFARAHRRVHGVAPSELR